MTKKIFFRWSVWALFALIFLALFSAPIFPSPEVEVAAPFSKPFWLDRSLPPTMNFEISTENPVQKIEWEWGAPSRMLGSGELAGSLLWKTPVSKDFTLLKNQTKRKFTIDTRDIPLKRALGIPPFANATETLFESRGNYELVLSGDGRAQIHIDGGRYGALGTDHRGRDILALFVAGIKVSLIIGISATLIASVLGMSLGLLSGYTGGVIDSVIMRVVDILMSIPTLPILLVMAGIWGKGLWQLVIVLSVFSWMGTARTVRAHTMTLRDSAFVEGLRGIGCSRAYILFRHLLPEVTPILLANIALGVPGAILAEASVSFLGLSDPRIISWGRMLHEAQGFGAFTARAWWILLPPGLGIAFICLVFMDIGKFLEEIFDPRLAVKSDRR